MAEANVGDDLPGTEAARERELLAEARRVLGNDVVDRSIANIFLGTPEIQPPERAAAIRDARNAEFQGDPGPPIPLPEPVKPPPLKSIPSKVTDFVAEKLGGIPGGAISGAASVPVVGPALAGGLAGAKSVGQAMDLGRKEGDARIAARAEAGSKPVQGATPDQTRAAILSALQGLQPQSRVVGMTKGGYQPAGRGEQVQVESRVPNPEWNEALARFTEHGRAAAEGESAVATELQMLQQAEAERRAQSIRVQAQAEEQALQGEERSRGFAEERLQRAIADFEASAPRAENYGTLFEEAEPGARVGGVVGALLGIFGGALSGQPSKFAAQLDAQIERRARAAEQAAQMKGQAVAMQENAYSRLERSLADSRAARAMLRGLYAEQAKSELEAAAARIGVGAEHPRLQAALAALEEKRLGYLRETASVVTQNARSEEKYVPPQAIVAQGPAGGMGPEGLLSKEDRELLTKYESELEKRGVLQAEQGISTMNEGIEMMRKEGAGRMNGIMLRLSATNPDRWGELAGQFGSPGLQTFLTGLTRFRTSDTGKATTTNELRDSANALGKGDPESLSRAMYNFNRRVSEGKRSLQGAGYGRASQHYEALREYYRSLGRGGQDFIGVPTPTPQTEGLPLAK